MSSRIESIRWLSWRLIPAGEIVSREGHGVEPLAKLDLEDDKAAVAKSCFAAREIEFSHTPLATRPQPQTSRMAMNKSAEVMSMVAETAIP